MAATIGIWAAPEGIASKELVAGVQRMEELGYETLWLAETFGRDPFALAAFLGAHTSRIRLATGIANIFHRHPGAMKQAANTVAEQTGGRFVLGLGISSPQIVERARKLDYSRPLTQLRNYLDEYEASRYLSIPPPQEVEIVLAALGDKMMRVARDRSAGALTYNMTPEHTARAREILGPDRLLAVEQKIILSTDPEQCRRTSAATLRFYQKAPGYRRAWQALGFSEEEIDGAAPRYLDALVAWGDEAAIRERIDAHISAGADHVCLQPLHPEMGIGAIDDDALRVFSPGA
jgi:probable F420-dependent oxidoreductase